MSVAKIYAKALYASLREKPGVNETFKRVRSELSDLSEIISQNRNLEIALFSPASSSSEKTAVIRSLLPKLSVEAVTGHFLQLLASKNRLSLLSDIIDQMDSVRLEADGGVLGVVTSADPLDPSDLESLSQAFSLKLKTHVELKVKVDPTLLAGFKVTVSGVTYDGSLKQQLERLKIQFTAPVSGAKA
jgi:F-type H+-transporting ATPase subunit delta